MARYPYDRKRPDVLCALELGWAFSGITGGGHLQFHHPKTGIGLILPATPSEGGGAIAWIRRNTPRED